MKTYLVLFLSILLVGCNSWGLKGSGNIKEEERNIAEFSKIDISGYFKVDVEFGETTSLKIITDDNFLPLIKTNVKNQTLEISTKKNLDSKEPIRIEISTPHLVQLECSGANNLNIVGIDEDQFYLEVSGACKVRLNGSVKTFKAEMSGATKLDAEDLHANNVNMDVSGASKAKVYASEVINASGSGASYIEYYGSPKSVNTDISGAGKIEKR